MIPFIPYKVTAVLLTRPQPGSIQKRSICLRIHLPGKAWLQMCKVRIHNTNQSVLWTSKYRISPLSSHTGIIPTIEWITRQILVLRHHFIGHYRAVWSTITILLKAHLPIGRICSQERETYPVISCTLYAITHLFGPVLIVAEREIGTMVQ